MYRSATLRSAFPAFLLLTFGTTALAAPQFLPADSDRVAVIAPGNAALQAVVAAGGSVVGGSGSTVYAVSAEPGFVDRLYSSGAWLVLRFDGAAGCLQSKLGNTDNARG